MEEFAVEGRWWLPDAADRRVPGRLTCGADGAELLLDQPLHPIPVPTGEAVTVSPAELTVFPVLYGLTRDGDDVTLFGAGGTSLAGSPDGQEPTTPR
jgi:hypothetical protein